MLRDLLAPTLNDSTSAASPITDSLLTIHGSWSDLSLTTITVGGATTGTGKSGTFSRSVPLDFGQNVILLRAVDAVGNKTELKHLVFRQASNEPAARDSIITASTLSETSLTGFYDAVKFLFTGSSPIQTGAQTDSVLTAQAAVVRGHVHARDGTALPNVVVQVLGHPGLGQTLTRADGAFDLVVNGGGASTLRFTKLGYLESQRRVMPAVLDYLIVDDVAMVGKSAIKTTVDTSSTQVAIGRFANDANGDRDVRLVLPRGNVSTVFKANGDSAKFGPTKVRATEFTIGTDGPAGMPALLPPGSAYTYCLDLRLDQTDSLANAAGTPNLQTKFSKPITCFVKNFLHLPVGTYVPAGYYDQGAGVWKADSDGVIVKVIGSSGSAAIIDSRGTGSADPQSRLDSLGITSDELTQLKSQYAVGDTVWRVRVSHFSIWDFNFNLGTALGALSAAAGRALSQLGLIAHACLFPGSIIECENRVLGKRFGVGGTPFSLNYRSFRALGDHAVRTVALPIIGNTVPTGLQKIFVVVDVAGRRLPSQEFDAPIAANTVATEIWDGLDAYGRRVQGSVPARVSIGYQFGTTYVGGTGGQSLSNVDANGETVLGSTTFDRNIGRVTWIRQTVALGTPGTGSDGLGGWTISPHHFYDSTGDGTVYLGDGSIISGSELPPVIHLFMGGPCGFQNNSPLPNTAIKPKGIALGPDGSVYVADNCRGAILQVTPAGSVVKLAGRTNDNPGPYSGDGTAVGTALSNLTSVAVGPDGAIYLSSSYAQNDTNNVVCRITADGKIKKLIGGVHTYHGSGDGLPASQATISDPQAVAIGPDGSVFIAEYGDRDNRVRRIAPNGIVSTYAGTGGNGGNSDSTGPAKAISLSEITGLATDGEGNLYLCMPNSHRVRKITPDGLSSVYASGGDDFVPWTISICSDGTALIASAGVPFAHVWRRDPDGGLSSVSGGSANYFEGAPAAAVSVGATMVAAASTSSYYVASPDQDIFRISRTLATHNANQVSIPSVDGSEVYYFSADATSLGRHLYTRDAMTGAVRYRFTYDSSGRLAAIVDVSGLTTTVQRDGAGNPIAIVGPFGQRTRLAISAGYLSSMTDTLGHARAFTYNADGLGLLASYTDPSGNQHTFDYHGDGRLYHDREPTSAGGVETLDSTFAGATRTVTRATAEGRSATYAVTDLSDGTRQRRITAEDGERTASADSTDSAIHTLAPDGTASVDSLVPDARFGLTAPLLRTSRDQLPISRMQRSVQTTRTVPGGFTLPFPSGTWSQDESVNGRTAFHTQFNADSLVFRTVSALGRVTETAVDTAGRPRVTFVAGVDSLHYIYDSLGLLHQVVQGGRQWQFDHDALGRLSAVTDPLGRITSFGYDAAGRLLAQTLPDSQVISFGYDASGNLTSLSPPGRSAHSFDYTAIDQTAHYVAPAVGSDPNTTGYTYNRDRQLTTISRPDGMNVGIIYEPTTNRLRAISMPRGSVTYTYLATGQVDSVTSPDGEKCIYTYDGPLSLSETWRGPIIGRVDLGYDSDFRRVRAMVDSTGSVSMRYDLDGLLVSVGVDSILRDPGNGRVTGTILTGFSVSSGQDYNNAGELRDLSYAWPSGGSFSQHDDRDSLGRVTGLTETIGGDSTRTFSYTYTTAGGLREVDRGALILARYDYDSNGNRITATDPSGETTGATFDAQDRLVRCGTARYTYTANGELYSRVSGSDTTTYNYDQVGNLVSVRLPNGDRIQYVVDGQNRRVGRTVNGHELTGWLYEGGLQPAAELDSLGNVVARYIYGARDNVPDYMVKGGGTYRIIADQQGSVRFVIDASTGAVAERIDYDAWGHIVTDTNPGLLTLGYAGGITDHGTGLTRFGDRDYDPTLGRWTAKDPIRFTGGSSSLMVYAGDDPINMIDPTGTNAIEDLNALAGTADLFTCGLASQLRDQYFSYNSIDRTSQAYKGGLQDGRSLLLALALGPVGGAGGAEASAGEVSTTSVFWSGFDSDIAANRWAASNGGATLAMSPFAPAADAMRSTVMEASRAFAEAASGEVHVFHAASGVRLESIWARVEYPSLLTNPRITNIVYHTVW
ncbi:MAG TPA: RHS repeat-associated core domain-containing protein [Gemmatimonadales bacterium]|nr:RHS repeat-associated core domain-containing protein [Gemmatimonadales bacterium]